MTPIKQIMRLVTRASCDHELPLKVAPADSGRLFVARADSFKDTLTIEVASVGVSVDNHCRSKEDTFIPLLNTVFE